MPSFFLVTGIIAAAVSGFMVGAPLALLGWWGLFFLPVAAGSLLIAVAMLSVWSRGRAARRKAARAEALRDRAAS